jgi:hypothetical protein
MTRSVSIGMDHQGGRSGLLQACPRSEVGADDRGKAILATSKRVSSELLELLEDVLRKTEATILEPNGNAGDGCIRALSEEW